MSAAISAADVLGQLERSLASGKLPTAAVAKGKHLLERLNSPVRVAIMGAPGSGKSQLLNLLAGRAIVPDNTILPTLELCWAKRSQTIFTYEDGTCETCDGIESGNLANTNATFVRLQTALPILERLSLLEVVTDGSPEGQAAAIDWAAKRADIALWCSQEFSPQERDLWSRVPDALKDHSFFVLTKADLLLAQDLLSDRIDELHETVADEFHSLVPVATLQAIAALQPAGAVGSPALKASGGMALIATILRQADLGRRADIDSVMLFLSRHGALSLPKNVIAQDGKAKAGSIGKARARPAAGGNKDDNLANNVISNACNYIQERAANLSHMLPEFGARAASGVLEHCTATANHLVEKYAEDNFDSPKSREINEDFMEAADVIQLMKLEDGEGSAADAVTLLLQLSRELKAKIAA
ncbi:MAG: hypothetical protein ACC631_00650 [Halocynthiibacter sp.]